MLPLQGLVALEFVSIIQAAPVGTRQMLSFLSSIRSAMFIVTSHKNYPSSVGAACYFRDHHSTSLKM